MKISTKGHYGMRIMLELALHYDQHLLTVKQLAKRQSISEKYTEQIIAILNKAELVRSFRGAQGGYCLARAPHTITVAQILWVTEGSFDLVECTAPSPSDCTRKAECAVNSVWREIKDAVEFVATRVTLAELVSRHYKKNNPELSRVV